VLLESSTYFKHPLKRNLISRSLSPDCWSRRSTWTWH